MTRRTLRRLALLACLVPSFASAELAVEKVRTDDGLEMDIRLDGAPEAGTAFRLETPGGADFVRGEADARAEDLWLLVDSSTFCQAQKVDGYVNRLVRALRKSAAPATRVTLVSYTGESSEVLLKDAPPSKLEEAQVECERRPMSSSFDAPLAKLLASTKASDQPLAVWVFTAGNLELSRATAQALVARGAELDVVLYSAFIEKDVRPMWQAAEARLAGLPSRFSVLAKPDGPVVFPSQRFSVTFDPKSEWLGQRRTFALTALTADAKPVVVGRTEIAADLPLGGWARFWRRFGRAILVALGLGLAGYAVHRTVRYYRAARCPRCERRVSFRANACFFCPDENTAYLVGTFRRRKDGFGRAPVPRTVLPIVTSRAEVGTHRQSVVRLPRTGRREAYFAIRREAGTRGPRFRLERKAYGRRLDLRINGVTVEGDRYLASGDTISVGPTTMVFRYEGGAHAH